MQNRFENNYIMNSSFEGMTVENTAAQIIEKDASFIKDDKEYFESFVHGLRLSRKLLEGYISVLCENALTFEKYEILSKLVLSHCINEVLNEYNERYLFVIHTIINMLTLSKELSKLVGEENILIDNTEIEITENLDKLNKELVRQMLPPIIETTLNDEVVNTKCIKLTNYKSSIKEFAIGFSKDYITECINATENFNATKQFEELSGDNIIKMPKLFIPGQNN